MSLHAASEIDIFRLLSKYRTLLMGFATLLVVIFHAPVYFHIQALDVLKNRLFIGVDVFIFLSGYGLYFSTLKRESILKFYYKRIKRIYPSFLIVVVLLGVINGVELKDLLITLSTLGYWWGGVFTSWYISAILMFYLLFPFYMNWFKRVPYLSTILTVLFGILVTVPSYWAFPDLRVGFFSRISIFAIGVLAGYLSCEKSLSIRLKDLRIIGFVLFISGAFISFLLNAWIPQYKPAWGPLPFLFIAPALMIFIVLHFEIHNNGFWERRAIPGLAFIGGLSLEIYLIHEPLFHLLPYPAGLLFRIGSVILIGILSVILAYGLNLLNHRLGGIIEKQKLASRTV